MAKPVIFDDGGSIRIRELDDGKTMDGLIGIPITNPVTQTITIVFGSASSQQFFGTGNSRCLLLVTSLATDGTLTKVPYNPTTKLYGQMLHEGDTIVISTTDTPPETVTVTFPGGVLSMALTSSANAIQKGKKRRYAMAKADMIQNVTVNGVTVFDAGTTNPVTTTVEFIDSAQLSIAVRHKAIL